MIRSKGFDFGLDSHRSDGTGPGRFFGFFPKQWEDDVPPAPGVCHSLSAAMLLAGFREQVKVL